MAGDSAQVFLYLVGRMLRRWAYEATKQAFEPEDTTYTGLELSFDFYVAHPRRGRRGHGH